MVRNGSGLLTLREAALLGALTVLLPCEAVAGEFRLLLEGEAGMRGDGDYRGLDEDLNGNVRREEDSRARGGLNLQLSYALERLNLALNYAPAYERSLDEDDDQATQEASGITHRLDFGLVGDLTERLRLSVRERLLKTPDLDLYAPVNAPVTMTVTRRGDQLSHALDVTLDHNFSRRASLLLGVGHSLRKFEEEDLVDSEALDARIGAGFEVTRGQRIEAAAGVGQYDFKERGDADIRTLGIAWASDFWRSSHVRLEAGAFSVDSTERVRVIVVPDPPDPEEPEGPPVVREVVTKESAEGFRGSLQFSQERRFVRWALGLSRDVSPGSGLGRAVEADTAFVGLSFPVGRRLELGLDGSASRQNSLSSRDGLLEGVDGNAEEDELTELAVGTARAAWTFAQAFRLEGGYSRVWQRSRVGAFSDLNYARYFLNLAFRIWSAGDTPREPESLGRPTDEASEPQ